jgi:hypothetical protein
VHTPGWRKPVVRPSLCALRRPPLLSVARVLRGALPWYAHRRPSRGTPSTPTAAGPLLSVRTGHPRGSVRSPERVLRQQDSAGGVVGGRVACGAQDVQQVAQVRAGPFRRRRAAVSRVTSRCRSAPSARRSVETSTCTVLAALAPARSPRTPSMIWCTGTTRSAPSSRTAGKARCFGRRAVAVARRGPPPRLPAAETRSRAVPLPPIAPGDIVPGRAEVYGVGAAATGSSSTSALRRGTGTRCCPAPRAGSSAGWPPSASTAPRSPRARRARCRTGRRRSPGCRA